MSFNDAMYRMLPGLGNVSPHITAPYGEMRPGGPHGGVDFNYVGGQSGVNLLHPVIHSPISGTVTFTGGQYGSIKIRDAENFSHEILHTHAQSVQSGQHISQGDAIGTMGGRGPAGPAAYAQHVHYQIKNPQGQRIDPQQWWDERDTETVDEHEPELTPGAVLTAFAFPFVPRAQGQLSGNSQFTNERDIYRLLATRETGGGYPVSPAGFWHGGIHVTEAGAGQSLDLDAGLRCIADGVLIAFRANRTYPVSEVTVAGGSVPVQAPYSTGFALVQHTMEFPPGVKLTFYSLYMHLMSDKDYENFPRREKPEYWPRVWEVTPFAQDLPAAGQAGQPVDPSQRGLRVRKTRSGEIIGILPQGSMVSVGRKEGGWGQLTNLNGASLCPRQMGGHVEPSKAIGGWIFMGSENGGAVVRERIPDSSFDRVVVPTNPDQPGNPQGIRMKAGQLIGHLGRYDSLNQHTAGTRMAHIEVFCDDRIESFIEQGRTWVNEHGAHRDDWAAVSLPPEPTILRIDRGTVLYQRQHGDRFVPGEDPQSRKTDAVRVYSLTNLARDPHRRVTEPGPHADPGYQVNWWHVDGVNAQGQGIEGWVRDFNFSGGRVTKEFQQKWVDFQCLAGDHDAAHTIFATTEGWIDYGRAASDADTAARLKLSPLMLKVYDALFARGDGRHAADELCALSRSVQGGYPWPMQAASRLIVKHESEWAIPGKWKQLMAELEKESSPEARVHGDAEQARIEKLVWWEEVRARVPGFPQPNVYHINPIAMTGNFTAKKLVCKRCGAVITLTRAFVEEIAPGARAGFAGELVRASRELFSGYGLNSCQQLKHFLAQAKHETLQFRKFRESLRYVNYTGASLYELAPGAIDAGFARKNMTFPSPSAKLAWIQNNLIANDSAYGAHCYGSSEQPGKDFRGRGLLHLTHYENYKRCARAIGYPIDSQPELVENNDRVIIEAGLWFWVEKGIGAIADSPSAVGDEGVKMVTRPINPGYKGLPERKRFKREISSIFNQHFSSGCADV